MRMVARSAGSRATSSSSAHGRRCFARSTRRTERYEETYFGRFDEQSYLDASASASTSSATSPGFDEDGYFWIGGRVDDVSKNVAGSRFAAAEVESAIGRPSEGGEAAVIGQFDKDSGQAICAFVSLKGADQGSDLLEQEIRDAVTSRVGEAWPARGASSGPTSYPRRARARSCAVSCATSPPESHSATHDTARPARHGRARAALRRRLRARTASRSHRRSAA